VQPGTRYAESGDASIAYQIVGDEPIDIVFVNGFIGNLIMPSFARSWIDSAAGSWIRPAFLRCIRRPDPRHSLRKRNR
jgi:hypothetical protein